MNIENIIILINFIVWFLVFLYFTYTWFQAHVICILLEVGMATGSIHISWWKKYVRDICVLTVVLLELPVHIRFKSKFRSNKNVIEIHKMDCDRYSVNQIINICRLFFIKTYIFRHLKLQFALAIAASNEWKVETNNSAAQWFKIVRGKGSNTSMIQRNVPKG